MDLSKEYEEITNHQSGDWYKPKQGTNTLVIIGEPRENQYTDEDGKTTPQIVFDIQVDKENYQWGMPRGKTPVSLWGQLVKLAKHFKYKFNGQKITLVVVGKGTDRRYTVLEAANIVEEEVIA